MVTYDPEISMNYNSKVDRYFISDNMGDMNGNFKLRQGDLQQMSGRKLSQSDPMLLSGQKRPGPGVHRSHVHSNTCHNLWEYQVINPEPLLKRQTTWHKMLSDDKIDATNKVVEIAEDDVNLIVDQITSTV